MSGQISTTTTDTITSPHKLIESIDRSPGAVAAWVLFGVAVLFLVTAIVQSVVGM